MEHKNTQDVEVDNKVTLEETLQELLKENDLIKFEIKSLLRKHALNHEKIDAILEQLSSLEFERESLLTRLCRQLSKFFFGRVFPIKKSSSSVKMGSSQIPLLPEREEDQFQTAPRGHSAPSLCQPMELEDADLTVSGAVMTIDDTEELMKEMTPRGKKLRIIVENGDDQCQKDPTDGSNKKIISPTDSFEEDDSPKCPLVLVPSASFGKEICLDLTGFNGAASTPDSLSVQDSPAVFLFGGEEETGKRKGDPVEVSKETAGKTPLTLEESLYC